MSDFYLVKLDGTIQRIVSPLNHLGKVENGFLVRKDNTTPNYYAKYTIIDKDGNPAPFVFGDYQMIGYETRGSQANYILEITFSYKGNQYSHTLHNDARWGLTLTTRKFYDEEWDANHPEQAVVQFLIDITAMGHEIRMKIDLLKRELFRSQRDLANAQDKLDSMRTICEGAEIIVIPDGIEFINGNQFDYCSKVRRIVIPESVRGIVASAFNGKHNLKEVIILGTRIISHIPPFPSDRIYGSGIICTDASFYVEDSVVNAYKNNFWWKSLADKIYPISELNDYSIDSGK